MEANTSQEPLMVGAFCGALLTMVLQDEIQLCFAHVFLLCGVFTLLFFGSRRQILISYMFTAVFGVQLGFATENIVQGLTAAVIVYTAGVVIFTEKKPKTD